MTGRSPEDQANISALCREAERLEEDALYSSKGHFNAEDTWVRRNYWLGVPATALGVIACAALVMRQPEWAGLARLSVDFVLSRFVKKVNATPHKEAAVFPELRV